MDFRSFCEWMRSDENGHPIHLRGLWYMTIVASVKRQMKVVLMHMAKLLCFFGMICGHCYCAGAKPNLCHFIAC